MNAPPFPTNPAFGQTFGNWVWNGSRWVCTANPGIRTMITVFTASAPYTPAPGLVTAVVEAIGGGGGGGAIGVVTDFTLWVVGTGGGGSGVYSRVALPAALVAGGVNVTIGAGGSGANGDGSPTTFGSLCVANGGHGAGFAGGAASYMEVSGGAGGTGGIGDVIFYGAPGSNGHVQILTSAQTIGCPAGQGGSVFGGSGTGEVGPGEYAAGQGAWANTGAGGGGAMVNQVILPAEILGGVGGSGICIVTEHCWADTDSGVCCPPPSSCGQARVAITGGPQGWGYEND